VADDTDKARRLDSWKPLQATTSLYHSLPKLAKRRVVGLEIDHDGFAQDERRDCSGHVMPPARAHTIIRSSTNSRVLIQG
jgi:hypothetical protein